MMRGIRFTDPTLGTSFHTGDDWDLVMSSKTIGTPPVKLKTISLADRDGDLDYTDALRGVPSYGTRKLEFVFEYLGDLNAWTNLFTVIRNFIHGRRLRIDEPDDTSYYHMGRCEVSDPSGGVVKAFTITVIGDTWRYKASGETIVNAIVSAGQTLELVNDWRPVVPTIVVDKTIAIEFGGKTFTLAAGIFRIPEILFVRGVNALRIVSGESVDISVVYQEGAL